MADLFDPPKLPSIGMGEAESYRILTTKFGDGYQQDVAEGLNNRENGLSLNWATLKQAEMTAIRNFFRERKGVIAFEWTPPAGVAGLWKCKKHRAIHKGGGLYSISATFDWVRDL